MLATPIAVEEAKTVIVEALTERVMPDEVLVKVVDTVGQVIDWPALLVHETSTMLLPPFVTERLVVETVHVCKTGSERLIETVPHEVPLTLLEMLPVPLAVEVALTETVEPLTLLVTPVNPVPRVAVTAVQAMVAPTLFVQETV
jgi:hypothetical protein